MLNHPHFPLLSARLPACLPPLFLDKHKTVGMAGASLLQLASAAAQGSTVASTAGAGQNAANAPAPPPQPEERAAGSSNTRFAGSQEEGGSREQRRLSGPTYPAVADAPRRRATYNEPLASGMEPRVPEEQQEPASRRRATLSAAPLLPSVQSLLEDMPMARLKRQREDGEGGSYDMDVDASSSLLRSPPPPPPPQPPSAQDPARLAPAVGISGGSGTERGAAAAVGAGDGREGGTSTPGGAARGDATHGNVSAAATAAAAAAADTSTHSRPPPKAARLFSRSTAGGGQQDGGWASRQLGWNSSQSPATTGYIVSSPAPDWRRVNLASMGRAASFDEARAAASKHGLNSGAPDSSKPRRASAFVSHGSALPPKMTEMNRRTSALDPGMRAAAAGRPMPHYSDLLSAKAPSRSLAAFNSYASHAPLVTLGNPDARIEEEESDPAFPTAPTSPGNSGTTGPATATTAAGAGGEAQGRRPPTVSRAARMFHMMPATAAFAADLGSLHPGETPPLASSSRDEAGGSRRWSVLDPGPSGPGDKEAAFVPAWGAPAEEGDGDEGRGGGGDAATDTSEAGSSRRGAATTGCSGSGNTAAGHAGGNQQPSSRAPRRGSMMAPPAPTGRLAAQPRRWPAAADPSDHGRGGSSTTANASAPAWGAPSEEEPAKDPAAAACQATGVADRGVAGRGGRARALFGGGGGGGGAAGAGGGGGGGGGEASSGNASTGARRWSVLDSTTAGPFSRPSWAEAAEERSAEGTSRSPVRQNAGGNGSVGVNSRRGSMASAPPGHSFSALFHGGSGSTSGSMPAPGSMGSSMAMLPPAPRRGSVVSHGPAMPPSQRRGSVTGMGTPAASLANKLSAGWQGAESHAGFLPPSSQ